MEGSLKKIFIGIIAVNLSILSIQVKPISRKYKLEHLCTIVNQMYQINEETERNYLKRKLKLWNKIAKETGYDLTQGIDNGTYCNTILTD